ncbi:MAG: DsbA family protein [Sphingomicrobium sp.]
MKVGSFLACSLAVLALAACNKNKNEGAETPAANDTIEVTQATPPPGGTWADVVNMSSAGGFVMGNPHAKVKLLEIGSLFCPYCKKFEDEGSPLLVENYVKPGKISWEFRPYVIHGPIDVAANIVARCSGMATFFPLTKALYKDQPILEARIQATPQDKLAQIQNLPTNQVFVTYANLLGLQDWAAARGLPQAKSNQCLSDQKMIDREVQITSDVNTQYPDFSGTPSFVLNGKLLPKTGDWQTLEPQLKEALK